MKKTQSETKNTYSKNNNSSFMHQINALPTALKKKFLAFMLGALMVAVVVVVLVFSTQDLRLCAGFLFCVYIAYLGMDIVWAYESGKIVQKKLVCFNAAKHPIMNCLHVIFQEYGNDTPSEETVHEFYIPNNKKNKMIFVKGTVVDMFFRPDTPYETMAWTILGSVYSA